jgi:hypothetical protein
MPAVDAMHACGKRRPGAGMMSCAKPVLSQAMKVPVVGPDVVMTVVTVTIMIIVIAVMMMMAIGIVRVLIVGHVVKGHRLQRRIIAPAQP